MQNKCRIAPGINEARWFKSNRCGGLTGELSIETVFSFGRWNIPNRCKKSVVFNKDTHSNVVKLQ